MAVEQPVTRIIVRCDQSPCVQVLRILPADTVITDAELAKLIADSGWQILTSKKTYCFKHKNVSKK